MTELDAIKPTDLPEKDKALQQQYARRMRLHHAEQAAALVKDHPDAALAHAALARFWQEEVD